VSSSATASGSSLCAAQCSGVFLHGNRRGLGSPSRRSKRKEAHPLKSWVSTSALNAMSNRTIRQLPYFAAECSAV
jgi:hypothetical protein